jgi:hypothetical protein
METVGTLRGAEYNPRTITKRKLDMLKKSMLKFGDLSGIVKNVRTGNLVGGHQRIKQFDPSWSITKAAHKDAVGTVAIGHIETPFGRWSYREVDWDDKTEKAANIAANKHGGDFYYPKLKDLFRGMDADGTDLEITGFELGELGDIFVKDIPMDAPQETPTAQPGETGVRENSEGDIEPSLKADAEVRSSPQGEVKNSGIRVIAYCKDYKQQMDAINTLRAMGVVAEVGDA